MGNALTSGDTASQRRVGAAEVDPPGMSVDLSRAKGFTVRDVKDNLDEIIEFANRVEVPVLVTDLGRLVAVIVPAKNLRMEAAVIAAASDGLGLDNTEYPPSQTLSTETLRARLAQSA